MSENTDLPDSSSDAEFLGWQKTRSGEVVPLYNITAEGHPSCGSTVTENSLRKLDLKVPYVPLPRGFVKKL
jgi:hypothetical protein